MLRRTELATFLKCSKDHKNILVYEQLPGDIITPITAAFGLIHSGHKIALLESGESIAKIGRYSFLGFDSEEKIYATAGKLTHAVSGRETTITTDPFSYLRSHKMANTIYMEDPLLGFIGGYVGYVGYDAVCYFEEIPSSHADVLGYPEIYLEWHKKGILFDHEKGVITIATTVSPDKDPEGAFLQARKEIEAIKEHITKPIIDMSGERAAHPVKVDMDDREYAEVVLKCKEYIRQGDAFQIVPSRLFTKKVEKHPFSIYRSLRRINPSPYMFYLETDFGIIFGASPEKLVSCVDSQMETIPLAGTRAKKGVEFDKEIQKELLADEKELSEHTMLVDLGRNDLGRVAKIGSVHVHQFASVLHFSHVMHLASVVQGTLKEGCDIFDLLRAVFPAGTLTGAPKVRAMEIIDSLEKSRRGPYGGAIVTIDALGNLDSCIAIRMAIMKDGIAHMRAGAGVVHDSIPENEVKETWAKIQVLLDAMDA